MVVVIYVKEVYNIVQYNLCMCKSVVLVVLMFCNNKVSITHPDSLCSTHFLS